MDAIGDDEIHGRALAQRMGIPLSPSTGALYKALKRLELRGHLTSRYEDTEPGRPARHYYKRPTPGAAAETGGEG